MSPSQIKTLRLEDKSKVEGREPVKVIIAGDGLAGSCLSYLFRRKGIEHEIYGKVHHTKCGIEPCGFQVNARDFTHICSRLDLTPADYILRRDTFGFIDGIKVSGNALAIDKPKLIADLLGDTEVKQGRPDSDSCDYIIDATGVSRAYSPPAPKDFKIPTLQRRVKLSKAVSLWAHFSPEVGYSWLIPLTPDGHEAHLGAGAIKGGNENVQIVIDRLLNIVEVEVKEEICRCGSLVRVCGPILPLSNGSVIAIGEAAGLVSPLTGAGNIPGMFSALVLAENWGDFDAYERAILKKYGYFQKEAEALQRLMNGKVVTPSNILAALRVLKFIDAHVSPGQFIRMIRHVRRRFASAPGHDGLLG